MPLLTIAGRLFTKGKLFKKISQIFRHGLNAPFIEDILESSAVSNFIKGTTGSGLTNAQIEQNEWNAEEAQKSRDWTEQMDNTKYQRQTQDMQAAGLNPAMMYGGSVSASGVTGAQASGGDPGSPSPGLLDSLLNVAFAKQRMANLKSEGDAIKARADESAANAELARANANLSETKNKLEQKALEYYPRLKESELKSMQAGIDDVYSEIQERSHKILNIDADTALKQTQKFVEDMKSKWIDRLSAAKETADKASAAAAFAEAAYKQYFKQFAEEHGGQTPGYNFWSGLGASVADALKDMGWSDVDLGELDWKDISWPALSFFIRSFKK